MIKSLTFVNNIVEIVKVLDLVLLWMVNGHTNLIKFFFFFFDLANSLFTAIYCVIFIRYSSHILIAIVAFIIDSPLTLIERINIHFDNRFITVLINCA